MQILKMLRKGGFVVRDLLGGIVMMGEMRDGKEHGDDGGGVCENKLENEVGRERRARGRKGSGEIDMEVGRKWRKEGVYLWEVRRKNGG